MGKQERFVHTVEKAIETYVAEGKNWKKELNHFLRVYLSTPNATTGKTPYELLFGRPMRTKLPEMSIRRDSDSSIYHRDTAVKQKMKQHADIRTHAKPCKIQIGDTVLVRQDKHNKLSTRFEPNRYIVTRRKGSMITAERWFDGCMVTRNSSFYKLFSRRMSSAKEGRDGGIR